MLNSETGRRLRELPVQWVGQGEGEWGEEQKAGRAFEGCTAKAPDLGQWQTLEPGRIRTRKLAGVPHWADQLAAQPYAIHSAHPDPVTER